VSVYHKKVGIVALVLLVFVTPFSYSEEGQRAEGGAVNSSEEAAESGFWYKHWWCPLAKSLSDIIPIGSDEPVLIQCVEEAQENDTNE